MNTSSSLTRFPSGTVREIATLSFPMMLTALSGNLMFFCDRIILGHYSLNAMNAAAIALTAAVPFIFGAHAITGIAEVFVGQFNGAKKYEDIGKPVWQMIWFSLFSAFFFFPAGLYGGYFIVEEPYISEGLPYYQWIMSTGWLQALHTALASFFVARGHVVLTTTVTILGNLANLALDIIFIFGIPGILGPMGAKGAAIATVISELIPVTILFCIFFNSHHQRKFHTHLWKINFPLFKNCLKIGAPNALAHVISMSSWYAISILMGLLSTEHITVFQIGQTIFVLLTFFSNGIQQGVIALASNAMGAKSFQKIPRILISAIKFHLLITFFLAIPFFLFPEPLIHLFLGDPQHSLSTSLIIEQGKLVLCCVWLFLFFDDLMWIISGILTAGGDTKFIMVMNSISAWIFGVLPVYFFVFLKGQDSTMAWQILAVMGIVNLLFFIRRYFQKKWKNVLTSNA